MAKDENKTITVNDGDPIDPVWVDVEDLSTIEQFGFIKADFEAGT